MILAIIENKSLKHPPIEAVLTTNDEIGLFGAAFGPVVILSLFWKRFTYPGAVAAFILTLISKAPSAEVVAIYEKATDNSIDD